MAKDFSINPTCSIKFDVMLNRDKNFDGLSVKKTTTEVVEED